MTRICRLADIQNTDLLDFIRRGMSLQHIPLVFDEGKYLATVEEVVNNHYAALVEEGGKVKAALGAVIHEMLWFHGKQSSIIMLRSELPGQGIKLLQDHLTWCREHDIRMVYVNYSPFNGKHHAKAMQRFGLSMAVESYAIYI